MLIPRIPRLNVRNFHMSSMFLVMHIVSKTDEDRSEASEASEAEEAEEEMKKGTQRREKVVRPARVSGRVSGRDARIAAGVGVSRVRERLHESGLAYSET